MVIICVFITGVAALAGFIVGMHALALAKSNHEPLGLRLIAWNMLEPVITLTVLFVVFTVVGGMDAGKEATFLLPVSGAVPLTWMLLAPLWTRVTHPIRGTLIAYGLLRWFNTVAFWLASIDVVVDLDLASALIVFGTLILCLSVTHLALNLSNFQIKANVTPSNS